MQERPGPVTGTGTATVAGRAKREIDSESHANRQDRMAPSIFAFILRHSLRQQIFILCLTATSWPILYLSLELPKRIINEAIGDKEGWASALLGPVANNKVTFLLILCFAFLFFVAANGGLKYYLNVYAGRLGERMLRRMRYELYARILRFPLPHFKKVSQGEIIPMITAEVEPLGGFIGIAFSTPAFMGGMLMVYLGFIFAQNVFLGLAAISLYPIQIYVIPKLQRRVNLLAKERVRNVRFLGDKLGESVSGINEIHAHDTSAYERSDISRRLDKIYVIRYEIFRRKYAIKFLNNFLAQLTPFFFYSIGGYLILEGLGKPEDQQVLTIGALVAVLAAYKDLSSPWKELLAFYQLKEDVKIKYQQVVEQFDPPDMLPPELQEGDVPDAAVDGKLEVSNVTFSEDGRVKMVEGVNFSIDVDSHVAIVGAGGSGKDEMVLLLARLLQPTGGSIRIGGKGLSNMPEAFTGRRISYTSAAPFLFSTTLRENLLYGLKNRPLAEPAYDDAGRAVRERYISDAKLTGNSPDDPNADWVDYGAAGVDPEEIDKRAIDLLVLVDMAEDMYQLGLRGTIDPEKRPDLAEDILTARAALKERLVKDGLEKLIEPFDRAKYNDNATLGENLLFGTPKDKTFDVDRLAEHPYVLSIVEQADLADELIDTGQQVAETMIELFSGLPPGHEFFEQYSFIGSDELADYQALVARTARQTSEQMRQDDRQRLISLPFKLIPARHRLGLAMDEIKAKVLVARGMFRDQLPDDLKGAVEFFDSGAYNGASTLQDNILFGKVAYGQAQAAQKLNRLIGEVLDEQELRGSVMRVGLDYPVGVAGSRLSAAQKQKLSLARCLIKRPDLLLINEGITSLDGAAQRRAMTAVLEEFKGRGVIWALHRAAYAENFDKVLVMRSGKVIEQGTYDELNKDGTLFKELLTSE